MSDIISAIILGIIEGITEFIPISSTGHLIVISDLIKFSSSNSETFNITIQLGAILAVLLLYKSFFKQFLFPKNWLNKDAKLILIAIIPALTLGFFFYSTIKSLFSPTVVAINLGIGGVIMIIVERVIKPKPTTTDISQITAKQALIIGLCQCTSLCPGVSRSGSTIVGGLIANIDHETSARFSFIIAVPVMIAAVGYDLLKSFHLLTQSDLLLIAIGFLVSFVTAWLSILTFLKILKKYCLFPFAIYRIILSIVLLFIFFA